MQHHRSPKEADVPDRVPSWRWNWTTRPKPPAQGIRRGVEGPPRIPGGCVPIPVSSGSGTPRRTISTGKHSCFTHKTAPVHQVACAQHFSRQETARMVVVSGGEGNTPLDSAGRNAPKRGNRLGRNCTACLEQPPLGRIDADQAVCRKRTRKQDRW